MSTLVSAAPESQELATVEEVAAAMVDARAKVFALERFLLQQPQADIQTFHHFAPGLYAREMRAAANVCLTGAIHKKAHVVTISQGSATLLTHEGVKTVCAPFTFVSPPGVKRAIHVHDDLVMTTYHHTNKTTVPEVEAELVCNSEDELLLAYSNVGVES